MKTRQYSWYVRPLDELTNRRVCEHFDVSSDDADKVLHQHTVIYSDRSEKKVNLIRLTVDQKNILLQAAKSNNYQFELFVQEGKGKIRFCPKKYAAGTALFLKVFEDVSFDDGKNNGEVETETENGE